MTERERCSSYTYTSKVNRAVHKTQGLTFQTLPFPLNSQHNFWHDIDLVQITFSQSISRLGTKLSL